MTLQLDLNSLFNALVLSAVLFVGRVLWGRLKGIDKKLDNLALWRVATEKDVDQLKERLNGQDRFWRPFKQEKIKEENDDGDDT